jgi:hypothetical protein
MTRRTQPRRVFVWAQCFGRAFLLSAIGVNRMRHENADAHEKKEPCCNIQHRTGSKARPYVGNLHSSVGRRLAATFRPSAPRSPCRGRSCALAPIGLSILMVGLIVAPRWLEKAGFEAHAGGMAESNRRSCYCRAVYHRTQIISVLCEISSFECELCGATLESWNSSWVPRYRLIAGPVRMPNDSQTP